MHWCTHTISKNNENVYTIYTHTKESVCMDNEEKKVNNSVCYYSLIGRIITVIAFFLLAKKDKYDDYIKRGKRVILDITDFGYITKIGEGLL